jgi:hypothetical protein
MKKVGLMFVLMLIVTGCTKPLTDAQTKALIEQCEKTGQGVYLFNSAFVSRGECIPINDLLDKILD